MTELDHNKKYMIIDGCLVTLTFAKEPNYELYGRLKDILLSSVTIPQNCIDTALDGKMQKSETGEA